MLAFELQDVLRERTNLGRLYHEFLRESALSAGVYVLPMGALDPQQPHSEDEVYVILRGTAEIMVGDESRPVRAGTVVYVPRLAPHHFHSITEELETLVLFAPAEGSQAELS